MVTLANIKRAIYNICKRLDILEASSGTNSGESSGGGFSGDYNDLTNKPTIPDAQIQSDWNQTDNTKKDYIKNKPTIPDALILSDWNLTNNNSKDYIKNKPTIPSVPGNESATSGGTALSVVTTGEKYNWNNKANIWKGTLDEYDLINTPDDNTVYIIIPDLP